MTEKPAPEIREELVILPTGHVALREIKETLVTANVQAYLLDHLEQERPLLLTPPLLSMPEHGIAQVRLLQEAVDNPKLATVAFKVALMNFHAHWVATATGLRPDFQLSELRDPPRLDPLSSPETRTLTYPLPGFLDMWFVVTMDRGFNLLSASFAGFLGRAPADRAENPKPRLIRFTLPNIHTDGTLCMGDDTRRDRSVPARLLDQGMSYARRWMHSAWGNHLLRLGDLDRAYALFRWDHQGRPIRSFSADWAMHTTTCSPYGHDHAREFFKQRARELGDGRFLADAVLAEDRNAVALPVPEPAAPAPATPEPAAAAPEGAAP